jgi:hypothetical protein
MKVRHDTIGPSFSRVCPTIGLQRALVQAKSPEYWESREFHLAQAGRIAGFSHRTELRSSASTRSRRRD